MAWEASEAGPFVRDPGGRPALTANGEAGAPGETRTPNPQIRSLVLYPIELRARAEKRAGSKGGNNYSTGP